MQHQSTHQDNSLPRDTVHAVRHFAPLLETEIRLAGNCGCILTSSRSPKHCTQAAWKFGTSSHIGVGRNHILCETRRSHRCDASLAFTAQISMRTSLPAHALMPLTSEPTTIEAWVPPPGSPQARALAH